MQTRNLTRDAVLRQVEQHMRPMVAVLTIMTLFTLAFQTTPAPVAKADAPAPTFANAAFQTTWNRTDYPIAQGQAARSWYWGPNPDSIGLTEDYADSPGGKRQVQYYDKARMEINDPTKNQVTNGLLVVEMINGRIQVGDKKYADNGPAVIPIAGDGDNTWPTYASLGGVYQKAQPETVGQPLTDSWTPAGIKTQTKYQKDPNTVIASTQNNLGIPAAFWGFLNSKGTVYDGTNYQQDTVSSWLFSTGLPITGAYWTQVKVGGVMKDVMFQAFERRTLTYTPSNAPEFQVEMGNVGAHYVGWRYPKGLPKVSNPVANIFLSKQPDWYVVTGDSLNVRTAPDSSAPQPEHTPTDPYIQTLVKKGEHVQPINSVTGEIIPGNNVWYQIYSKPDLFVYSGYVQKMTLPNYATPPRTHSGIWVSVDLSSQMLAVFDGSNLIYKTMISSGVPSSDPDKDHRTPSGVFKIDGTYRPANQTMTGGEGDKATGGDYYNIKNIRNVSYFYQDYSIHGTYWHAWFGVAPESHGCVNATVYDAGLVYQLPAGTTVDLFREDGA